MAICEVLGALVVGGAPLTSPRQRRLLAALTIARGAVVSSDRLADIVWEGEPPDTDNALQTYVSRLRGLLGTGSIVRRPPGYALVLPVDAVDAWLFETMVDQARHLSPVEALTRRDEALGLWRGAAYAEFADDEFARAEVVRLEEMRALAEVARLDNLLDLDRPDEAAGDAVRLIEADLYREPVWERRMRALHAAGRTVEALRVFREYRTLLADETGLEPSADLAALERALLASPSVSAPVGDALPSPLTTLVGRDAAREELVALVASRRVVTLVGPGGVGKTRLALEVARAHRDRTGSPVSLVELAAIGADGLVAAVFRTLGLAASADPVETMRRALVDHLLVLDNCEHVVESAAELIATLASVQPTMRVLATSRTRLGVAGEQVWVVSPLPMPDPRQVEGLADLRCHAATRLFLDRVTAVGVAIEDRSEPARSVAGICAAVDGLPLGIELAAAMTGELPLERIAEGLDRRTTPSTPRHRSLDATMWWSHELLDPDAQRLFRRLAVFEGSWTVEATETVCASDDLDGAGVPALLAALVAASLVTFAPATGRYSMLETVHTFARARLADADETVRLRDRHLDWCRQFVRATAPEVAGSNAGVHVRRLDTEHRNIVAALRWALADDRALDAAAGLARDLLGYWHTVDAGQEVARLLDDILDRPAPPTVERAELTFGAGHAWVVVGDFRAATIRYDRALDLCRSVEAPRLLARCLLTTTGNPDIDDPSARITEAMAIAERLCDEELAARAVRMLGTLARHAGRYDEAAAQYEHVIHAGDVASRVDARYGLALVRYAQGRWEEARDHLLVVEHDAGESGSWAVAADACVQLTLVELALNQPDRARRAYERSSVWGCAEHPGQQLELDAVGAMLRAETGDLATATAIARRLVAGRTDVGDQAAASRGWLITGEILARAGELTAARQCFGNLLRHRQSDFRDIRANGLEAVAGTLDAPDQRAAAAQLASVAATIRARYGVVAPPWLRSALAGQQRAQPRSAPDRPVPTDDEAVALALTYDRAGPA